MEEKAPKERKGVSGTPIYSGVFRSREFEAELNTLKRRLDIFHEMKKDAVIARCILHRNNSVVGGRFSFVSGDDSDSIANQYRDELNDLFGFDGSGAGRLNPSFKQSLKQMLSFVDDGFRYGECNKWEYNPKTNRNEPTSIWLDCSPLVHNRWIINEDGEFLGVTQHQATGQVIQNYKEIPSDELLLLVYNQEGDDLTGNGYLRPCYEPWLEKVELTRYLMIASQRASQVLLRMRTNRTIAKETGLAGKDEQILAEEDRVWETLHNMLEQNASALHDSDIVSIEPLVIDFDPSKIEGSIKEREQLISKLYQLAFQDLGTSDTGSRAVGEIHQDEYHLGLVSISDQICDMINGPARPGGGFVGRYFQYNGLDPKPSQYPRLIHSGLAPDPVMDSINMIPQLVQSGILRPTLADENFLREKIGWLQREEETLDPVEDTNELPEISQIS